FPPAVEGLRTHGGVEPGHDSDQRHPSHAPPPEADAGPTEVPVQPTRAGKGRMKLLEQTLTAVLIVSLVSRVGFHGDVASQLADLCDACGAPGAGAAQVAEIARRLKQSPGFIAVGERYLYVTPRLIAHAAFRAAWGRWVGHSPNDFFAKLPAGLEEPLIRQLRNAATQDVRRLAIDYFQSWVSDLGPNDLKAADEVLPGARVPR